MEPGKVGIENKTIGSMIGSVDNIIEECGAVANDISKRVYGSIPEPVKASSTYGGYLGMLEDMEEKVKVLRYILIDLSDKIN